MPHQLSTSLVQTVREFCKKPWNLSTPCNPFKAVPNEYASDSLRETRPGVVPDLYYGRDPKHSLVGEMHPKSAWRRKTALEWSLR